MNFLNRNQYTIYFSNRCNFNCSYCCTKSSPDSPKSVTEANPDALVSLFNQVDPGVIFVAGGEPIMWKALGDMMDRLPQHYWTILTNLSGVPKWLTHSNVKLVVPAYHEEEASPEKFGDNLAKLRDAGKPTHAKIIVKPEREYEQIPLWEKWNAEGTVTSLVPLEYTFFFRKTFLVDLITKFRTSSLYNARFFRSDVVRNTFCRAGTREMFQVNPDGAIVRCSTIQETTRDGDQKGNIFLPQFNAQAKSCSMYNQCYCEWHHWASMSPAHDNDVWTEFAQTGRWRPPTIAEMEHFVREMGWNLAGRTIERNTESLFAEHTGNPVARVA